MAFSVIPAVIGSYQHCSESTVVFKQEGGLFAFILFTCALHCSHSVTVCAAVCIVVNNIFCARGYELVLTMVFVHMLKI